MINFEESKRISCARYLRILDTNPVWTCSKNFLRPSQFTLVLLCEIPWFNPFIFVLTNNLKNIIPAKFEVSFFYFISHFIHHFDWRLRTICCTFISYNNHENKLVSCLIQMNFFCLSDETDETTLFPMANSGLVVLSLLTIQCKLTGDCIADVQYQYENFTFVYSQLLRFSSRVPI